MAATPQQLSDFTQASMAEFNLFLGTARKSVGDVTLMRRAGRQIARVRLRTISNPKSEAQAIQRNFVAPVARFYGPLRHVLKRSFEGLNADRSYNQFLSTNVELARKQQWFMVKGAPWSPMPYQLSAGSLRPFPYTVVQSVGGIIIKFVPDFSDDDDLTVANVSYYLINDGFKDGDVITFIGVGQDVNGQYSPYSAQFVINSNDRRMLSTLLGDSIYVTTTATGLSFSLRDMNMIAGSILYARKYKGQWLRSSQFLSCSDAYVANLISQESRDAAIASYQTPNSEEGGGVYPGGDDNLFNVAAEDGRALLFIGGQYTAQTDGSSGEKRILLKPDNYDQFYYVKLGESRFLGTNSAGSLNPADWRAVGGTPAPATQSNTIDCPEGSQMYLYLQSIGWTGV